MRSLRNSIIAMGVLTRISASCSHTDPTQFTTTVCDENSVHIKDAVMVPIVKTSKRISFGPDGQGVASNPSGVIARPFLWGSGDDLVPEGSKSSGVMFFPMAVAANDVTIKGWLLLKGGYEPLVINYEDPRIVKIGGYYLRDSDTDDWRRMNASMVEERRRKVVADAPMFALNPGGNVKRKEIIRMLTSTPPDRKGLSEFFSLQIETFDLGVRGRKLIKAQED